MNTNNNKTILFSIPDFWYNFNINMALLNLMDAEPEKFHPDIKIDSCYGSFPCIWNGGRIVSGNIVDTRAIQNTLMPFIIRNISIRHTFTNLFLTPDDFKDTVGNCILDLSNKCGRNGVNVSNMEFKKYIEEHYPNLYILLSTTLDIHDIDELNKLSENNIVVPSYKINNKFDILSSLKHPENIEILVGEPCVDDCPLRKEHYIKISKEQHMEEYDGPFIMCPHRDETYYDSIPLRNHYISTDMIREKYLPLGLNKFKITGRDVPFYFIIEQYVNYLVKPEFRDDIRIKLISSISTAPENCI